MSALQTLTTVSRRVPTHRGRSAAAAEVATHWTAMGEHAVVSPSTIAGRCLNLCLAHTCTTEMLQHSWESLSEYLMDDAHSAA